MVAQGMDDNELEHLYPHRKGDILQLKRQACSENNQWKISKYMIGGYEILNLSTGEYDNVLDDEVEFAIPDLKRIFGHESHEVIISYIKDPYDDSDRYIYCRDCKKEINTRFSKLPPPTKVYFI